MPRSLRQRIICQNQEALPERVSFCGLFSVNNALQQRDLLTCAAMKTVLLKLKKERPDEDHGHPRDGAYSTHAMHLALKGFKKRLIYMNKRFASGEGSRAKHIVRSQKPALLIIGRRPGQQEGTWHCIARATVGKKHLFIESDNYMFYSNDVTKLTSYFQFIDGVYSIEDIPHTVKKTRRRRRGKKKCTQ